mgnify:CR=1 FL=1
MTKTTTRAGGAPARLDVSSAAGAVALLAASLHAEAGTRPVRAIEALAAVVANRARDAGRDAAARLRFTPALRAGGMPSWPMLVAAACRAPFVFAGHCAARYATTSGAAAEHDPAHAACRRIAARALAGTLGDPTGGATHWHVAEALPAWAVGQVALAEIGGLVFYRPRATAAPPEDGRAANGPPEGSQVSPLPFRRCRTR